MIILLWIGITQSLFAAILMFTKKENSLPDKILSGLLTLLAIEFTTCLVDYQLFSIPLLSSSFLLLNPALYIYIRSLTQGDFSLRYIQLLHLLPFVGFEIYAYISKEPLALDNYFVRDEQFIYRIIFGAANLISWSIYNPLSLILVHRHRMNLRNEQSHIEKNDKLGWVLFITIFYVVYCLLAILSASLVFFGSHPLTSHFFNYSVLLVMILIMSAYGQRQQKVPVTSLHHRTPVSYQNSLLSEENKQIIAEQLILYFEQHHPWLNPDLNMDALATALKVPKYQLTEVLNTQLGRNFFQFVNQHRVEAVKKMLADPKVKYSIEAIGYECGFASKSAFYTVFKQMTRQTPTEYRQKTAPTSE